MFKKLSFFFLVLLCSSLFIPNASAQIVNGKINPKTKQQLKTITTTTKPSTANQPKDADGDGHDAIIHGGDDCDDNDANRFPGNVEVADPANHDEDCDPTTFGSRDQDGDGFIDALACNRMRNGELNCGRDCDDRKPWVHPNQMDVFNGEDDNCNGAIDEHQSEATIRRLLGLK